MKKHIYFSEARIKSSGEKTADFFNPRDVVKKTLTFSGPDRIPRQFLNWNTEEKKLPSAVHGLKKIFPEDLIFCPLYYVEPQAKGLILKDNFYLDEWGCRYQVRRDGSIGKLVLSPLSDWSSSQNFRFPEKRLNPDINKINEFCKNSDRFVLMPALVCPFEQLQALRGPEQVFLDLNQQSRFLFGFLEKLHQFFLQELTAWARTEVDALLVVDDWASQESLLVSPHLWRRAFKPLYADYARTAREHGKFLFFHSDGFILEIIEDLIEIGIQAINLQLSCYQLKRLGRLVNSRVTLWGGFDSQMLSSLSLDELKKRVMAIKEMIVSNGGFIAAFEIDEGTSPEKIQSMLNFI